MKNKLLMNVTLSVSLVLIFAFLITISIQLHNVFDTQKEILDANNITISKPVNSLKTCDKDDDIMKSIEKLSSKLDDVHNSVEKECVAKAMQTVINIFSTETISLDTVSEYKFDYLNNKAYQYYLEQRELFKGQHLSTANVSGSWYDAKKGEASVIVWFAPDKYNARTQYEFIFTKVNDRWILDSFGLDS